MRGVKDVGPQVGGKGRREVDFEWFVRCAAMLQDVAVERPEEGVIEMFS